MNIEINQMDTEVTVQPNDRPSHAETGFSFHSENQLKVLLRPIVMELLEEELEHYLRMRG